MSDAKTAYEATFEKLCPICQKPDWCLHLPDGAVVCNRLTQAPSGWIKLEKQAKNGGFIFRPQLNYLTTSDKKAIATWKRTGKYDRGTSAFEKEIIFQYSPTQRVIRRQWTDRRAIYKDRSGKLKTKLVRPQYLDGDTWKWGKGPAPWPIYGEDEIKSGESLIFVGGETCVEALRQWGFSATCNQGGEGQYHKDIAERLKRLSLRSLIIWPDHDDHGYKSAEGLLKNCEQNGIAAAILNPLILKPDAPAKWDAADWEVDVSEARVGIKTAVQNLEFKLLKSAVQPPKRNSNSVPKLAQSYQAVEATLGNTLRLNELTKRIELNGKVVEEPDDLRLTLALDHGIQVSAADCVTIINRLSRLNSYHPIQEYLNQCSETYGTSTEILEGIAERYFGNQEPIYQTFFIKTLVAAVARVFEPGCKVDTALILQGPQGYRKSSFFRTLAGSDWFDDSMGSAMNERDERLKLHQFWFLEWAELEGILKRKDTSAVKSFLSCQVDTVRPPYGRNAISLKRRCIIVGSTNQSDFLSDATGNRRFWVVPVQHPIDIERLMRERDQIWAAALALYKSGYPLFLSQKEESEAAELNESYQSEDPWYGRIVAYLRDSRINEVTTSEILTSALEIDVSHQSRREQMRASEVLKSLGWKRRRKMFRGTRRQVWFNPESLLSKENVHSDQPKESVECKVIHGQSQENRGVLSDLDNLDNLNPKNNISQIDSHAEKRFSTHEQFVQEEA